MNTPLELASGVSQSIAEASRALISNDSTETMKALETASTLNAELCDQLSTTSETCPE